VAPGGERTATAAPSSDCDFGPFDLKKCTIRCRLLFFLCSLPSPSSTACLCSLRNMVSRCSWHAGTRHAVRYISGTRNLLLAANKFPGSGRHLEMHVNQGRHPCRRWIVATTLSRIALIRRDVPGAPIAGPGTHPREARGSVAAAALHCLTFTTPQTAHASTLPAWTQTTRAACA
jgi:hypothetical protein